MVLCFLDSIGIITCLELIFAAGNVTELAKVISFNLRDALIVNECQGD